MWVDYICVINIISKKSHLLQIISLKIQSSKEGLDSFITGEIKQGAVFRALPIYRVRTYFSLNKIYYKYIIV